MSVESERLRRRLYLPGATEADLAAYRAALVVERPAPAPASAPAPALASAPAVPPPPAPAATHPLPAPATGPAAASATLPPAPPRPHRSRRRRLAAPAAAVGAALAVLALLLPATRPAPAPTSSVQQEVSAAASPLRVRSSSLGLSSTPAVQRAVDAVFADPGAIDPVAGASLAERVRTAALPRASDASLMASLQGDSTGGSDDVRFGDRAGATEGEVLEEGVLVVLTVIAQRPTVGSWEVLGRRPGEGGPARLLADVRPVGEVDRVLVAVIRVPERVEVTGLRVRTDPGTPVLWRWEQHVPALCAPTAGDDCAAAAGL